MTRQSLSESHPELVSEWHPNKNLLHTPDSVTHGSNMKIWWLCPVGHSYEVSPKERTSKAKQGCPYCSNRRILSGFNDLATIRPTLAKQWNSEKNHDISPSQIAPNSTRKFWWICEKGHEFESSPRGRRDSCAYCLGLKLLAGYNDLVSVNPELAKEWDTQKNSLKPYEVLATANEKYFWKCMNGHSWQATVASRKNGRGCPVCVSRTIVAGVNDLATIHPEIAAEWHPTLNGEVQANSVSRSSGRKVWWLCSNGHEYEMTIANRTSKAKQGCPYCSNKRFLVGYNDLLSARPNLAKQWHPTLNGEVVPSDVFVNSSNMYWWKCQNGHEWESSPKSRKDLCVFCSRQKMHFADKSESLLARYPQIAKEWDSTLNTASPEDVFPGSSMAVNWKCDKGHSWKAVIYSRVAGRGCPFCANKKVLQGFNDLATIAPLLASEWDQKKNQPITASQVMLGSNTKFWWICPEGHSFQAAPNTRNRNQSLGCPVCSNKQIVSGLNDLATLNPSLAGEWHPTKNGNMSPTQFAVSGKQLVWWTCAEGHEWQARIYNRSTGTGCPNCAQFGFKSNKIGILYFISNDELRARKIGITNKEDRNIRLNNFARKGWKVVHTVEAQGSLILKLEKAVLNDWIRSEIGLQQYLSKAEMDKFGGETETFEQNEMLSDIEIINRIDSVLELLLRQEIE